MGRRGNVAQLTPVSRCTGKQLKALLVAHRPDPGWRDDLEAMRDLLEDQPRWS